MESLKKIKEFLTVDYGSGAGTGSGYGDGSGSGAGSGAGYGSGYGSGSGAGYGSGYGSGSGAGYGSGDGAGSGYGDGYGDGSGEGIKTFNGNQVYIVDGINTIINHVKGAVAKGYIVNQDFTLTECYIAKGQQFFAHSKTLKEAQIALEEKIAD